MTIYEHTTSMTTASGSTSSATLKIPGGLLRYLLIRAQTSQTTEFRANLVDENNVTRLNYAYHVGEIVDDKICIPIAGRYTINITNASPDDTFQMVFSVQE